MIITKDHYPLVPATLLARLTIWLWGIYAIWQGGGIIRGGPERWAGPSFAILRGVDHPTITWGTALMIFGAMILAGSALQFRASPTRALIALIMKGLGCIGTAVWSVCLAWGAFVAAHHIPTIPTTGGKTYAAIATAVVILVFVDERKRPVGAVPNGR